MIQSEAKGAMPELVNNLPDAMQQSADLMRQSIVLNFLMAGRPNAWPNLANHSFVKGSNSRFGTQDTTPLVRTGKMMNSVSSVATANTATAGMMGDFPRWYWIHQTGGWAGRGHRSFIPQRRYVMFQDQDIHRIQALVAGAIKFINPKGA